MLYIKFGMSGTWRAPLAELLDIVHSEHATQREACIEHRAHVARIKEEAVTSGPSGIIWIVDEKF